MMERRRSLFCGSGRSFAIHCSSNESGSKLDEPTVYGALRSERGMMVCSMNVAVVGSEIDDREILSIEVIVHIQGVAAHQPQHRLALLWTSSADICPLNVGAIHYSHSFPHLQTSEE